jgi:hypothetical protein
LGGVFGLGEYRLLRLLSLQSTRLKPRLKQSWELEAYQYQGRTDFYRPDEVLYFINLGLEGSPVHVFEELPHPI